MNIRVEGDKSEDCGRSTPEMDKATAQYEGDSRDQPLQEQLLNVDTKS